MTPVTRPAESVGIIRRPPSLLHDERSPRENSAPCIWLAGLPSAGKTTIANGLAARLGEIGVRHVVLDADELRRTLNVGLGFSRDDRLENGRRIAVVAKLFAQQGLLPIVACISPYRVARQLARSVLEPAVPFLEVWINTPVDVCAARDMKGLYARARAGEISNLVGVNVPFEPVVEPAVEVSTVSRTVAQSVEDVLQALRDFSPATFTPATFTPQPDAPV